MATEIPKDDRVESWIPVPPILMSSEELTTAVKDIKTNVNSTLNERGSRYGSFKGHAEITQSFKNMAYNFIQDRGCFLSNSQQEALDMIFHKIGRIINGDPNYADSWHDIAGYASLVDKELNGEIK